MRIIMGKVNKKRVEEAVHLHETGQFPIPSSPTQSAPKESVPERKRPVDHSFSGSRNSIKETTLSEKKATNAFSSTDSLRQATTGFAASAKGSVERARSSFRGVFNKETISTPRRATRRAPSVPREPTKRPAPREGKRIGSSWVFILLIAAFVATLVSGLHEGAEGLQNTVKKTATLSAQMTYPQGGQTVAAREMDKLHTLFSAPAQVKEQVQASSARQK